MPIFQAYNKRNKSWVKYEFAKKGIKIRGVKTTNPKIPFKGIKIRSKTAP